MTGEPSSNSAVWRECGTCEWSLDGSGGLVIRPADGVEGTLGPMGGERAPWWEHRQEVTSVRFEGRVRAIECDGMFHACSDLASLDLSGWDTSHVGEVAQMLEGYRLLLIRSF